MDAGNINQGKDTIGYTIKTLDNLMVRTLMAYAIKNNVDELTIMHGWIIGYLKANQHKKIFQKDIEKQFCINKSTVTNIVKLMEKKEYIKREGIPEDARLKKLTLTEKGLELYDMTIQLFESIEQDLRTDLSPDEIECFMKITGKMKNKLETRINKIKERDTVD